MRWTCPYCHTDNAGGTPAVERATPRGAVAGKASCSACTSRVKFVLTVRKAGASRRGLERVRAARTME